LVAAAAEAGVVTMSPESVVNAGGLGPGQMLLVDTRDNSLLRDADAKERAASRHDYGMLADASSSRRASPRRPGDAGGHGGAAPLARWALRT